MFKDDYKKAGLKMLPVMEPDGSRTNRQIIWHSFFIDTCFSYACLYWNFGYDIFLVRYYLGVGYLISGFILAKQYSVDNARFVLRVSVFYLPILFLTIMIDKIS